MVVHETYQSQSGEWLTPKDIRIEVKNESRKAFSLEDGGEIAIGSIEKMSKSKKIFVDPDDIIQSYGADTARLFMLSDSPPDRDVIWSEEGIQGASRYLQQVWRLINVVANASGPSGALPPPEFSSEALAIRRASHSHLSRIQEHIERLRFNTAIAEIRKLTNAIEDKLETLSATPVAPDVAFAFREAGEFLVKAFAPMMPHLAEECWCVMGHLERLVSDSDWPMVDEGLATSDQVTIAVQVNGKRRGEITVDRNATAVAVESEALKLDSVRQALQGRDVRKIIVVPQRVVNVVI
jgi:leucyl-tRNA synthetase